MALTLEEHIERSRQAVEANRAKGNRHAEFLSMLYADPFRFLDEIIQNTEDAYARRNEGDAICTLRFCVFPDRLDIMHNGIDFDENDLKALTTFAGTTKTGRDTINQIGKFGIGFRSVYAITQTPEIHCHPWHYRIEEYEILEGIAPAASSREYRTLIRLPFKKEGRSKIYRTVVEGLKKLDEYHLLFLRHLNRIEICHGDKPHRSISCLRQPPERNLQRVSISVKGKKNARHDFLVLSRSGSKTSSRFSMAFRLEPFKPGGWMIIPDPNDHLFVYLPTQQSSGLRFLFHADFATTATREQVPFSRDAVPENITLLHRAASFFVSCLPAMRDQGYLRPAAFRVLLFSCHSANAANAVSRVFAEAVQSALKTGKFMPVARNSYEISTKSAFTNDPDIAGLLNKNALQSLFQRSAWLVDEFAELTDLHPVMFSVLDVKYVDAASLGFRISVTPGFIRAQKRDWFARFYSFLALHSKLWDEAHQNEYYSLRNREIILLQNGTLARAFDASGRPALAAGGGRKGGDHEVDRRLQRDEDADRFFRMLGLAEKAPGSTAVDAAGHAEESAPAKQGAERHQGILVSPAIVAEKTRVRISDFTPEGTTALQEIKAGIGHSSFPVALLPFDSADAVRDWAIELAALLLTKQYPASIVKKTPPGSSSGDLMIRSREGLVSILVACRKPGEVSYTLPQRHWFTIRESHSAGSQGLALVADAGSLSARVHMIMNPAAALAANRFVFDDVGFRLL